MSMEFRGISQNQRGTWELFIIPLVNGLSCPRTGRKDLDRSSLPDAVVSRPLLANWIGWDGVALIGIGVENIARTVSREGDHIAAR
jgi:hypothetical protein